MANSVALQGGTAEGEGVPMLAACETGAQSLVVRRFGGGAASARARAWTRGFGGWMGLGCRMWDRVGRGVEMAVLVSLRGRGVRWGGEVPVRTACTCRCMCVCADL
jgi:hypothetical protein